MALDALPRGEEKRLAVRAMFDRIAPRYDLLNRLLTGSLDQRWRRRALDLAAVGEGDVVLDLACGTGDLGALARRRGARVLGVDFAGVMLREARRRGIEADWLQADAEQLPLPDHSVDIVVCGFALRNFVSLPAIFAEMARVLVPQGRIALLEVDRPTSSQLRRLHSLYFDRVVPWVGGLLSDRDAYRYLPRSTSYLPATDELIAALARAGFTGVRRRPLLLGTAQILLGMRR
ncbi:MAG: ubiquinone/menaquinone biosynthesis methyltransferase [Myxococcales bacterium]|nr:ubiquinone/menaquinone biosynthesis methyltransferase [Myxococcales bacterium]